MRTVLRFLGYGLLVVLVVGVVAAAAIYERTERMFERRYDVPGSIATVPATAADVAEGERLARLAGCADGCHGDGLSGGLLFSDPMFGSITAPDLTRVAQTHTDAEMERVIRHGVRKDGTSALVMPVESFGYMTDAHLGKILAYIRSQPVTEGPDTEWDLRLARGFLALGLFDMAAERADAEAWPHEPGPADPADWGEYLALTLCTECHGADLTGSSDSGAPDLAIAGAYSADQFAHLLRTGEPMGDQELDLMARVARSRFTHFTDGEIAALHTYLRERAGVLTEG